MNNNTTHKTAEDILKDKLRKLLEQRETVEKELERVNEELPCAFIDLVDSFPEKFHPEAEMTYIEGERATGCCLRANFGNTTITLCPYGKSERQVWCEVSLKGSEEFYCSLENQYLWDIVEYAREIHIQAREINDMQKAANNKKQSLKLLTDIC